MTDLIVRILQISTGVALISITLITAANSSTAALDAAIVLLPLIAVPVIFSGIFGWHPLKSLGKLIPDIITPLKQLAVIKPHSSSL